MSGTLDMDKIVMGETGDPSMAVVTTCMGMVLGRMHSLGMTDEQCADFAAECLELCVGGSPKSLMDGSEHGVIKTYMVASVSYLHIVGITEQQLRELVLRTISTARGLAAAGIGIGWSVPTGVDA